MQGRRDSDSDNAAEVAATVVGAEAEMEGSAAGSSARQIVQKPGRGKLASSRSEVCTLVQRGSYSF